MKQACNASVIGVIVVELAAVLVLCSCADKGPVKRSWGKMKGLGKIVGNMNDVSYSTGRTQKPRVNALGKPVSMTDFEGQFVWAEYAAPWCKACAWQTPQTQKIEKQLRKQATFLTIMTSKSQKYDDHATLDTAKQYANRHGLPKQRVLAAKLWAKTIPEHRFYSPQGHTLFVHVGALSAEQIREVVFYYMVGWEKWAKTGEKASWMTFK